MEVKIQIKTPKGYATKIEKQLRPWLIGFNKPKEIYVNKANSKLYWVMDSSVRRCMKIQRNVTMYESMINRIMGSKKVRKMAKLNEEQTKELDNMLLNQTEIKIIKKATADEIVENNKTFWQNVKEKFTRKE